MSTKNKKLTATERFEQLEARLEQAEKKVLANSQSIMLLGGELEKQQKLLNNIIKKVNSIIVAAEKNNLSNEGVKQEIISLQIQEMEGMVKSLVDQKVLYADISKSITSDSFIIARELDKDSNLITPRIQVAVQSLTDDKLKESLIGKNVGDIINSEATSNLLEIVEVYHINTEIDKK